MFCLYVYMYAMCICAAQEGQKRATDSLELELKVVVIYHVGTGDLTWLLCKGTCFLSYSVISICSKITR